MEAPVRHGPYADRVTNSHAENAQDGQHRPDVSGTPDDQADPQATDARGGGQGAPLGDGGGPEDQLASPEVGTDQGETAGPPAGHAGAGAETPAGSAGAGAVPGPGDGQDDPRAEQDGVQDQQAAQDEATKRLAKAVRAAEQALIEFEIAVETFRVEVENFSRLHHQRLGPMYARLDELDAQIAEAVAARSGRSRGHAQGARRPGPRCMPMPGVEELFHGWMDSDGLFPEAQAMLTEQPVQPPQQVRPSEEARKALPRPGPQGPPRPGAGRRGAGSGATSSSPGSTPRTRGATRRCCGSWREEWEAGPAPEERLSESEELYARLEWLAERKELLAAAAAGAGGERDRRDAQDGAGGPGPAAGGDRRAAARRGRRTRGRRSRSWSPE